MQQLWVGAALLVVGLLFCFLGHRVARIVLALGGAAVGYGCGLVIYAWLAGLSQATMRPVPYWAIGLVGAVLFALAAYALYAAGVLVLLGSIGWGLGLLVVSMASLPEGWQLPVCVILALVLAGIGVAADIPRKLMIVGTAVIGAAICVDAVQQLTAQRISWLDLATWGSDLQPHLVWLGIFVVLAAAGIAVQWRQHGAASLRAAYS
jgi:hypothetical protein